MLDTNILIYLMKNKPSAIADRANALAEDDSLCMSFITWAELLKRAQRSIRKDDVQRRLDVLARLVPVWYADNPAICRHYASQFKRLKDAGMQIGADDVWIARHALSTNATLVTHNRCELERITELKLEDWVA